MVLTWVKKMALFDYSDAFKEKEGDKNQHPVTVTVGVQDDFRVMVMLIDEEGKTSTGFTLHVEKAKTLLSLLEAAINSIEKENIE